MIVKETKSINEMREILHRGKVECKENSIYSDEALIDKVLDVLNIVGRSKIYKLVPDIYPLLESDCEWLREEAVVTLGYYSRLQIPEFRDKAYEIWLNDPSEDVKEKALFVWIGYYNGTEDSDVLKILYGILCDEKNSIWVRYVSLRGILSVTNESFSFMRLSKINSNLSDSASHEEFNKQVKWEEVRAVVEKYAPQTFS